MKTIKARSASWIAGIISAFALTIGHSAIAWADDPYPSKPIKFVLPSAPGGTGDKFARVIAKEIQEKLGQVLIFDYRQGSGSNIGMEYVAKAAPDGYTLLLAGTPLAVNPSLYRKLPFDPKALTPISLVSISPYLVVVNTSLPIKTIGDLIAYTRAHPGQVNFSSPGMGSGAHLSGATINEMAGINMTHIPYKSAPQALVDVIGGSAQLTFTPLITGKPLIDAGKIRAIAVTSLARSKSLPNVPTVSESGLPGFDVSGWYGVMAPTGTPPAIINRLNQLVVDALRDPQVVKNFAVDGLDLATGTPQEFADYLKKATEVSAQVVEKTGAKID
jgi:tripartite-type tricarboxylate transporter receptor subunit TctC